MCVLNINKPMGMTSHDVVYKIRKLIGKGKKVGHTGTLDPLAEGVLPICIGKATKISQYILSETKSYRVTIHFGVTTDTLDSTGQIVSQNEFNYNEQKLLTAMNKFKGEYMQLPPMYSAIKKSGKKLYELARCGIEIVREKRLVHIYKLELAAFYPPDKAVIDVECSKGTYMRSLCDDIGNEIGCGANMSALTRTRSGQFFIEDSIKLSDVEDLHERNELLTRAQKIEDVLHNFKRVYSNETNLLYNGNKLKNVVSEEEITLGEKVLMYDNKNNLVGVYCKADEYFIPVTMLL